MNANHRLPLWKAALGVFLPSFIVFVLLDYAWITTASSVYQSHLKPILKPDVDAVAALLSWICIVAVNQVFVLPSIIGRSAFYCLGQGALMGVLLYGTVDLTNCALLTGWSWTVALVDMAWGTTACAVLSMVQSRLHAWLAAPAASDSSSD
ncbi:hypothetical protein OEZ85_000181 [Tetradesmus obliquus]|uniref:Uncharacterized protein n=1 Tax=Tetradesmus obliquus TaxID=3088 RepID=A0ABY8UPQ3_TETOB|nr:hypothetical protein OEZ85_000181 [Tetradesmus obliquus]